ncbi:uncharacterized abhydrolase domain-containing protein DDB_G0269086-like [Manihot esculenta]|uniref:uncharacterized abhydrolase domain-containing protein DDB_G0269086-like n=1 Tax=Manihot esculenta TaxID=3983 RepID=UPI000B5D1332|nr:uncharacterized abhydrolase domain-containing protein DDB_G0269086-like [Manihot esculenta]
MEIIPAGEDVQEAPTEVAPVTEGAEPELVGDEGAAERVRSKHPPPSETPALAPIPKRSRASRKPAPALPPLEKKKETSVIEEARLEENIIATSDARGHLAAAQEHLKTLREELAYTREAVERANKRAAAAEVSRDEALEQLSSLGETQKERDEAVSQRDESRRWHESLKEDFDVVLAQKDEALARIVVLGQKLSRSADNVKDLNLAVETTTLQNQHLCQEVEALKKRCAALLEDAKLAEDRVQLECEERLREYKEPTELKREIEQACEAHLQSYKDSFELKAKIVEACEDFNQGLREARYAPSTPLAELRAAEVDSDGEDVLYGEDDRPLPKGAPHTAAGSPEEDTELGEEDEPEGSDVGPQGEDAEPQGGEIVPFVNSSVGTDNVDNEAPRNVSPLRTIFPPVVIDD